MTLDFGPSREKAKVLAFSEIRNKLENVERFIVLDTETNGLNILYSVLSIGGIKCRIENGQILEEETFERYYFPVEPYEEKAIEKNGLTQETIEALRNDAKYPAFCKKDKEVTTFLKDVTFFVGHNIEFDLDMIPPLHSRKYDKRRSIDTMKLNTDIVQSGSIKYDHYKWPTLEETARYYNITKKETKFHNALFDAQITLDIFKLMYAESMKK